MAVSMGFTICLTSIAIGSEVAYGIFVSLNASGLLTSYIICIACVFRLCFALSLTGLLTSHRCPPKATSWRQAPNFSFQPWQSWQRNQHHSTVLPHSILDISIFPGCSKPGAERNELELRDMDKRPRLLHDLLRNLGTAQLRRAYRVC